MNSVCVCVCVRACVQAGCQPNAQEAALNTPLHSLLLRMIALKSTGVSVSAMASAALTLLRFGARLDIPNDGNIVCAAMIGSAGVMRYDDAIAEYASKAAPAGFTPPQGILVPLSGNARSMYGRTQRLYHCSPKEQWVPDSAFKTCNICSSEFGMITNRRHHVCDSHDQVLRCDVV